jgi:hypothetical protein
VPVFDGFSVVRTCGVTFVIFAAFAELYDASIARSPESVVVGVAGVETGSFFVSALRQEAISESTASDVWGLGRLVVVGKEWMEMEAYPQTAGVEASTTR